MNEQRLALNEDVFRQDAPRLVTGTTCRCISTLALKVGAGAVENIFFDNVLAEVFI